MPAASSKAKAKATTRTRTKLAAEPVQPVRPPRVPGVDQVISKRVLRQLVRKSFDGATPEMIGSAIRQLLMGVYRDWMDACAKMLRDPVVRRADGIRRSEVAGRPFAVKPAKSARDNELAQAGADALREKMDDDPSLEDVALKMLSALGTGLSVAEIHWHYERGWWVPRFDVLRARDAEWMTDGGLGVRDADNTLHRLADHPGKFWVFVPNNVAGEATEQGDLLSVAYYWIFKTMGWKYWLIASERYGNPLALGRVPRGAVESTRQQLLDSLLQLTGDSVAVVDEGSQIEIIDPKASQSSSLWKDITTSLDEQITIGLCGAPDILKPGETGSYSAVRERSAKALRTSVSDARQLWTSYMRDVGTWFFRFNAAKFGGVAPPMPYIETQFDAEVDAAVLIQAIGAGLEVEQDELRQSIGLDARGGDAGTRVVVAPQQSPQYGQSFESAPRGGDAGGPFSPSTSVSPQAMPLSRSSTHSSLPTSARSRMTPLARALSSR